MSWFVFNFLAIVLVCCRQIWSWLLLAFSGFSALGLKFLDFRKSRNCLCWIYFPHFFLFRRRISVLNISMAQSPFAFTRSIFDEIADNCNNFNFILKICFTSNNMISNASLYFFILCKLHLQLHFFIFKFETCCLLFC